jgi:hypothetical protein
MILFSLVLQLLFQNISYELLNNTQIIQRSFYLLPGALKFVFAQHISLTTALNIHLL